MLRVNKLQMRFYPSKILLFGEYTVISGSDALAFPFNKFRGRWNYKKQIPDKIMLEFAEYLKNKNHEFFNSGFNHDLLVRDLNSGLFFDSDIPVGYGAGSSGALTAAVFDSYFIKKEYTIIELKSILAVIENFFHSSSSGIDPLVSYISKFIKISGGDNIEIKELNIPTFSDYCFYLLDSGKQRLTRVFVDKYKKESNEPGFIKSYIEPQTILTNSIINSFLNGNEHETFELFRRISELQLSKMNKMIIPEVFDLWKSILQSGEGAFKLCGAGGGGFYLVMVKSTGIEQEFIDKFRLLKIEF